MHQSSAAGAFACALACLCWPTLACADGIGKGTVYGKPDNQSFVCDCSVSTAAGTWIYRGRIKYSINKETEVFSQNRAFTDIQANQNVTIRINDSGQVDIVDICEKIHTARRGKRHSRRR
ncbi:MAG TPA: hypothetical protein VII49_09070 [Rhizomicrobium sp.]